MSIFEKSSRKKLPRNRFVLTHDKKFSFKFGRLYPIFFEEAVPGDSFRVNHELMIRLAPMVSPAYCRLKVKCESFFVPKRLTWSEYESFRTGGVDGTEAPVVPFFASGDMVAAPHSYFDVGTIWDFLGLPCTNGVDDATGVAPKVSALPFRALAMVYNDWYRIPGITEEIVATTDSGEVTPEEFQELLAPTMTVSGVPKYMRMWEPDYFTTAQPAAQRGPAAAAPIDIAYAAVSTFKRADGTLVPPLPDISEMKLPGVASTADGGTAGRIEELNGSLGTPVSLGGARIENLSGASVLAESIRLSEVIQQFLEAMQRGGARYTDFLLQIFGRRTQDSRLQRSELLAAKGGNVVISEVLSTVQFEGGASDLPQGNMAGHGIMTGRGCSFDYTAPEDGYFITLLSLVPEGGRYGNGFGSGIHKMFQRFLKFDEYIPHFANLGEQPIKTGELCNSMYLASNAPRDVVFGYAPRYSEYKWRASTVHGDFRTSLQHWHENRGFTMSNTLVDNPMLNQNFLAVNASLDELDRIFAVQDPAVDHFWCLCINHVSAVRPMPYNPIPSI